MESLFKHKKYFAFFATNKLFVKIAEKNKLPEEKTQPPDIK